jgi:hypothetical protein
LALLLQFVTGPPTAKLALLQTGLRTIFWHLFDFWQPEKHDHTTQFSLSFQNQFWLGFIQRERPY